MAVYVILNDDYLESGYVDSTYVGTDSDLYVESGYIQDAIEGVSAISAQSTVAAKGGFLQTATVTASSAATISIDADVIREATITSASATTLNIDGDVIRNGSASSNSVVSSQVSAVATLDGVVDSNAAWTSQVSATGIIRESSAITATATLTSTPNYTASAVVNINAFQTHPTLWGDDISWNESVDKIWGPMVQALPETRVNGEASSSSQFGLTVDGDVTAVANISPAAIATVDVSATFIVDNSVSINTQASLSATGITNADIRNLTFGGQFDVSVSGIFQVEGRPNTINSAFDVAVDGDVVRDGIVIKAGAFGLTATPSRTRPFEADISSQFTLTANADRISDAINIITSAGTLLVNGDRVTDATINIDSEFTTTRWVGGKLFGGIADITGFFSQVSALTLLNIDPYRVYVVDDESRTLGIIQETRIYTTKSENRLNTIEQETRAFDVPSETRALEVQPLRLVEVSGNPLDRRTG